MKNLFEKIPSVIERYFTGNAWSRVISLQIGALSLVMGGLVVLLPEGDLGKKVAPLEKDDEGSSGKGLALRAVSSSERDGEEELDNEVRTSSVPGKVASGLVLLPQSGSERILLLDEKGNEVHSWKVDSPRARVASNGNLLALHGTKWGTHAAPWKKLRNYIREYNWQGEVVWEYKAKSLIHHDFRELDSGNILMLQRRYVSDDKKEKMSWVQRPEARVRYDTVVEIDRDGKQVWVWDALEHLDLESCGQSSCKKRGKAPHIDWTHMNTASILPENHWFTEGDNRFKPGNVIVMLRNWSTAMIIDRKSGEIVWSYQGDYLGGLSGGHEAEMIPPGLPGAGNILIFDNGRSRAASVVLEINPVNKEVVWKYEDGNRFFSKAAGSAQRLPNGNTLISEDVRGKVIEVTPIGEVVWSYESPYRGARARKYRREQFPEGFVSSK